MANDLHHPGSLARRVFLHVSRYTLKYPSDRASIRLLRVDARGPAGRIVLGTGLGARQRASAVVLAAAALCLAGGITASNASSAAVAQTWRAPVASTRSNGSATLELNADGTGTVRLRLSGLAASHDYGVWLYRGTCSSLDASVMRVAVVRTSTVGSVTRGITLSSARAAIVRVALRKRVSVVVGSARRCGTFTRLVAAAPAPSVGPGLTPTPVIGPIPFPPLPPFIPPLP